MNDEKDKEIKELEDARDRILKENSDTMELMRNQLQQYARDYEEERTGREKFAQQMMKIQQTIKDKDEEIDNLQEQLTKFSGSLLRPSVDVSWEASTLGHLTMMSSTLCHVICCSRVMSCDHTKCNIVEAAN